MLRPWVKHATGSAHAWVEIGVVDADLQYLTVSTVWLKNGSTLAHFDLRLVLPGEGTPDATDLPVQGLLEGKECDPGDALPYTCGFALPPGASIWYRSDVAGCVGHAFGLGRL